MVGIAARLVREKVIPELGNLTPRQDGVISRSMERRLAVQRTDAGPREVARIIGGVKVAFEHEWTTDKARAAAKQHADAINTHSKQETEKVFKALIGISPVDPSDLTDHLDSFIAENVRLIQSVPETLFGEIEGIISRGARAGDRIEKMAAEIQQRLGVAESRAYLIARDQTNKLYGSLTKDRQTATGVMSYIWRTSRDERVRPTHEALEGQTIQWDDPPTVGHVGQDFNCRCTAEPNIDELLQRLEGDDGED